MGLERGDGWNGSGEGRSSLARESREKRRALLIYVLLKFRKRICWCYIPYNPYIYPFQKFTIVLMINISRQFVIER